MKFGKVVNIESINFSLPPDGEGTKEVLAALGHTAAALPTANLAEPPRIHVGCPQWRGQDWIGRVYPKGTKEKDFLAHYVKQFNAIELNAMFYHLQPKAVIEKWASLANQGHQNGVRDGAGEAGFKFCPKFSNTISHIRQLNNVASETDQFIDHMQSFGSHLGYSFLQLSDGLGPAQARILQDYLRLLPRDFPVCVELRQEDWFNNDGPAVRDTWQLLRELKIGTVITDTAGRRDCAHMKLTGPVAFIRFVGNNLHPTDLPRIDAWVERIKSWLDRGLREIYFFVHCPEELHSPDLCQYAMEQFNKRCGTNLKPPVLTNGGKTGELTLF